MKGEIEEGRTISANLALASPLLSRFDLIFLLLDRKRGDSWDSDLCDRLLGLNAGSDRLQLRRDLWDFDQLKGYVNLIRSKLNPKMTGIAELLLSKYYQLQRRTDSMKCARTTVRLLESLVRLAQSHAKLMFHSEVTLEDAMTAVILSEASLTSGQTLDTPIDLHSSEMSEVDYREWYKKTEREMLYKLEINKNNLLNEAEAEEDEDEEELDNLLDAAVADDSIIYSTSFMSTQA